MADNKSRITRRTSAQFKEMFEKERTQEEKQEKSEEKLAAMQIVSPKPVMNTSSSDGEVEEGEEDDEQIFSNKLANHEINPEKAKRTRQRRVRKFASMPKYLGKKEDDNKSESTNSKERRSSLDPELLNHAFKHYFKYYGTVNGKGYESDEDAILADKIRRKALKTRENGEEKPLEIIKVEPVIKKEEESIEIKELPKKGNGTKKGIKFDPQVTIHRDHKNERGRLDLGTDSEDDRILQRTLDERRLLEIQEREEKLRIQMQQLKKQQEEVALEQAKFQEQVAKRETVWRISVAAGIITGVAVLVWWVGQSKK